MSDLPPDYNGNDDEGPTQNTMADLPGQLKSWLGNVGDRVSGWANDAATIVNDFITRRDIADQATAEANQFTSNVQDFSRGLDEVVRADPTATNMAFGLAAITVPAIVADHPHLPDDQREPVANALAGEIGKSIAQNAVVGWAQRDTDTAHAELKRLGGLFTDDERSALSDHVNLLGDAKQMDAEGAAIQEANRRAEDSHQRSLLYGDELLKPDGAPNFNPDWARRVVNDQGVAPDDSARLLELQRVQQRMNQLSTSGTVAPITNGNRLLDFIDMAGNGMTGRKQLFDQAIAGDISLQDAQTLIRAGQNPADLATIKGFVANARKAVKGPDGDLDPDGTAMAKLAHDVLHSYGTMGVGSLDPNDPNFFGAMRKSFGQNALDQRIAIETKARRLEDIFAQKQQHAQAMVDRQNAQAAKQAGEFGLRQDLAENRREQTDLERSTDREEKEQQRDRRLELRDADRQQRAQLVAASTQARLDATREDQATAQANAFVHNASRVPAERPAPAATDVFRRFGRLGRAGLD